MLQTNNKLLNKNYTRSLGIDLKKNMFIIIVKYISIINVR